MLVIILYIIRYC